MNALTLNEDGSVTSGNLDIVGILWLSPIVIGQLLLCISCLYKWGICLTGPTPNRLAQAAIRFGCIFAFSFLGSPSVKALYGVRPLMALPRYRRVRLWWAW